jgi:hypothetical protein
MTPVYTISNAGNSINELSNKAQYINIYPNPTEGYLHIQSSVKVNARITGIDGKTLLNREDAHKIDISMLAAGIYMLHLTDQSGAVIKVEKLVKL